MFDHTSRYRGLPTHTVESPDGREVVYVARRFCPRPESLEQLAIIRVRSGQRLDAIAQAALGSAELFWRIADANNAMDPFDLAEPGEALVIPLPTSKGSNP